MFQHFFFYIILQKQNVASYYTLMHIKEMSPLNENCHLLMQYQIYVSVFLKVNEHRHIQFFFKNAKFPGQLILNIYSLHLLHESQWLLGCLVNNIY